MHPLLDRFNNVEIREVGLDELAPTRQLILSNVISLRNGTDAELNLPIWCDMSQFHESWQWRDDDGIDIWWPAIQRRVTLWPVSILAESKGRRCWAQK
ncbi:hypothetical protein OUZ56_022394 [Daphnia magna]|uniref:Uncharacterized protein n=1 Tax=Daphnia magna TaxID=35525 RepID=A0ABR0AWJ2_9CRUS|nr:hypothetical protein OUZ56_022394 [Daphnia magna]